MCVIIVDDNEHISEFLSFLLQDEGYDAVSFHCPEVALSYIQQHGIRPRYLITDFNLPIMTGYQLHQAVSKHVGDIKTIVISGRQLREEIGGLPFLQKPFSPDDLLQMMQVI